MFEKLGLDKVNSSVVAFNFIVHDPSGIIECVSDRSFISNF